MDGMFQNKQRKQNEIVVQQENNYDVWSQKLVFGYQQEFMSPKELEQKRAKLSKKERESNNRTLLEEENIHLAGTDAVSEKEQRANLYTLATTMSEADSVYTFRRNIELKNHEERIETMSGDHLLIQMRLDINRLMDDDLLSYDRLSSMGSDENLFMASASIAALKEKVEKVKLDMMYIQGTQEAKSGLILKDADKREAFFAKFRAAQMLIIYQQCRLSICSDTYYRDRELKHMMTATSKNGKRMQLMMEDSKQKYLKLLECIDNLPADELEQLEADNEIERMAEEAAQDEVQEDDPELAELERELSKDWDELLEQNEDEAEPEQAAPEEEFVEEGDVDVEIAAPEEEFVEEGDTDVDIAAPEMKQVEEGDVDVDIAAPEEEFVEEGDVDVDIAAPEMKQVEEGDVDAEVVKQDNRASEDLDREIAQGLAELQGDYISEEEEKELEDDFEQELLKLDEEEEEAEWEKQRAAEQEMIASVVTVIPSELRKSADDSIFGSIGRIEQKETDEITCEVRRIEFKRQLAEDISNEVTDNKDLQEVFSKLRKYADLTSTNGDVLVAKGESKEKGDEVLREVEEEKKLIFEAVTKLSQMYDAVRLNNKKAQTMDEATKSLIRKYYDRLKRETLGKLEIKEDDEIHVARLKFLPGESGKLSNGLIPTGNEKTVDRTKELLFPHKPCMNDVLQGEFKDCMFMGALTSIVLKDPEQIEEMMYDHGDTVTVRFYKENNTTKEYEPYYINVPKATTRTNTNSAVWVQILEVAYGTFRYYTLGGEQNKVPQSRSDVNGWMRDSNEYKKRLSGQINPARSYKNISNDQMLANVYPLNLSEQNYGIVYEILTGKECVIKDRIQADPDYYTKRKTNNMELYLEQLKEHAGITEDENVTKQAPKEENAFKAYMTDRIITRLLAVHLFQEEDYKDEKNPEDTLKIYSKKATVEDVQDLLSSLTTVISSLLDEGADAKEVTEYLKAYRLDAGLGNDILNELNAFPGDTEMIRSDLKQLISERLELLSKYADKLEDVDHREFSGKYSDHAIETFNDIALALAQGKRIGAASYAFHKKGAEQGAGGETKVDGIAYGHQYTILGVSEGEFRNAKYIKLRNPWGLYSREYEINDDQVVSKVKELNSGDPNHGIVYVELNEFMNKFRNYSIG